MKVQRYERKQKAYYRPDSDSRHPDLTLCYNNFIAEI